MDVTVESTGTLERRMRVELPIEPIEQQVNSRLQSVGKTAKIKGFRPGKVPAKVVRQHYGGQVELVVGNDRFDASSVLDLQWAGGKIQKENITEVIFEGDARTLKDIDILATVNYGEDTMGKGVPLPKELSYLK